MSCSLPKKETARAGKIAMDLVRRTLFHTGIWKFRKPSITNCPAYVPVIVELYPAANSPTAHIYFAGSPNVLLNASAAVVRFRSVSPGFLIIYTAKVEMTQVLMINEILNEIALSMAL